jgi:hypothetical protein
VDLGTDVVRSHGSGSEDTNSDAEDDPDEMLRRQHLPDEPEVTPDGSKLRAKAVISEIQQQIEIDHAEDAE